jgi:ribosomal protein S18 acetylase RimI-like enzyme
VSTPLRFETIDLAAHAERCVAFRRDSYRQSFGDAERFDAGAGAAGYLEWLRGRIAAFPRGHVHVWQGSEIIGQLELRSLTEPPPPFVYVNLFYLVPAARGSGAGDALHTYAREFAQSAAVQRALLSVSPSNLRALRYYQKHGWRDIGPSPHDASCQMLQLDL